jgi:signal transduction histidine kinase/CheY-like chemotaxis protein
VSHNTDYLTILDADQLGVDVSDVTVFSGAVGDVLEPSFIATVVREACERGDARPIYFCPDLRKGGSDALQASGICSAAVIPLRVESMPGSCLVMVWIREKRSLSSEDLENLIFYCRLVAILCWNILTVRTVSEQSERLSALIDLSTTIYSSLNYQAVLQKVIDFARSLASATYATIYILDHEQRRLQPFLSNCAGDKVCVAGSSIDLETGAEGEAASRGEGVIVNGVFSDHSKGGSRLALPLISSGETIGVLSVHRESGMPFTLEDLQFLSIFARQAADVIENARMFRDLQDAYEKLSATQKQMVETERMRVMGEMACGVAHDFNNILGSILGRAQLLQRTTNDESALTGLAEIEKLALQGADTVRRTQEFARVRSKVARRQVMINDVIKQAVQTTKPLWKEQAQFNLVEIDVTTNLAAEQPIAGSFDELVDAMTSLVQNAVEAMPKGGRIEIGSYDRGDKIVVEVVDDGEGMSDEVREKALYPFFSTKGGGKAGLGLSVAYGVLNRHNATVEIESQEGEGARVRIVFQARPELREAEPATVVSANPEGLSVLLVDDDKSLLEVTSELLEALGHNVITAEEGIEALSRFDAGEFDLVVTDLGLPGMSGWDIANAVKLKKPGIPVVLISGWGAQISESEIRKQNVDLVVPKPFTMRQLGDAIRKVYSSGQTDKSIA